MVGAVIHPGLVPARLPDVAGVGSEYRDPSPTPHGAQRGARHLPAIVNVAQSAERPPCKGQVARSTRAVGSGLCGCEFIEPYNSDELSASAEHHGGTPIRPWRIGTARNEERAKRLVTGRERPAISLRSSMVEHHRRRTARGAFDGLPCLRGPDHSALTARGARLVDGGDARSIRAGGAVDKTQTEPLALPTRGSVPVLRRCA